MEQSRSCQTQCQHQCALCHQWCAKGHHKGLLESHREWSSATNAVPETHSHGATSKGSTCLSLCCVLPCSGQPFQGGTSHPILLSHIGSKAHCQSSDWWLLSIVRSTVWQRNVFSTIGWEPLCKNWASCSRTLWTFRMNGWGQILGNTLGAVTASHSWWPDVPPLQKLGFVLFHRRLFYIGKDNWAS